jgi:hypothetical protein
VARSEEDILAGVLRITIGASTIRVPERTIEEAEEWQGLLAEAVGRVVTPDLASAEAFGGLMSSVGHHMNALLVAYDQSGQVTIEALRRATPAQAYQAFRQVIEAVYPYVRDVQTAASILMPLLGGSVAGTAPSLVPPPGPASTNGRSPVGATARGKSAAG